MAFWGAPIALPDAALQACSAALQCRNKIIALNRGWTAAGKSPMDTRIGIHFGEMVVGNVGAEQRINYSVIGDNVNTASRLAGVKLSQSG